MQESGIAFIVSLETIGKPQRSMSEPALLDLDRFLPYRLSRLSNRISQQIASTYVDRFDLSVTEWRVMAVLGRYPGLSANEVAERTAMDKVAVSRAVARLVQQGRLRRDVAEDDRRRSVLQLTAAGRKIYAQVAPEVLATGSRLLGALDRDELALLMALLEKLEPTG
ncbi:MarR family transcriptional regulator [Pseudofulvimonas gallinarii]|jgi:DNA-binding MarR family transcriptional regulator|uniref:MarR family transcriptional regulator n=2 Tax=Pseudofulvimonas gallinarii TaxID=634155 RepID=A0A4S3KV42_9GAMM|nr:MarR family transcriptional regulator [Pseudofulvimonas gallinarii]THD13105.1 MarR family transcriptional regulator [Pseudofulvimonas gallinarii]